MSEIIAPRRFDQVPTKDFAYFPPLHSQLVKEAQVEGLFSLESRVFMGWRVMKELEEEWVAINPGRLPIKLWLPHCNIGAFEKLRYGTLLRIAYADLKVKEVTFGRDDGLVGAVWTQDYYLYQEPSFDLEAFKEAHS